MHGSNSPEVIVKLQQILLSCKKMQVLLQDDKQYVVKNNLPGIEDNNQKKVELLNQLSLWANELSTVFPEVISHQSLSATSAESKLMQELRNEISKCYKLLAVNSNVIFGNLQQLRDLWTRLIEFNNGSNELYDHTGLIK